jgi:hypothetical protein
MGENLPRSLKEKPWLSPACVISLTLGLYFIAAVVFPEFDPYLLDSLEAKGLIPIALILGSMCMALPILILHLCVELDRTERGEDDASF